MSYHHYAYVPTPDGKEPLGTERRMVSKGYKTDAGFIRAARQVYGDNVRCFRITGNFYDAANHVQIFPKETA